MSDTDRSQLPNALGDGDHLHAARLIEALGPWAERVRVAEVARAERRLRGLTATEREIVHAMTRSVVGALLREATKRLTAATGPARPQYAEVLRHLFALDAERPSARRKT